MKVGKCFQKNGNLNKTNIDNYMNIWYNTNWDNNTKLMNKGD